jgi:hypothetical protein
VSLRVSGRWRMSARDELLWAQHYVCVWCGRRRVEVGDNSVRFCPPRLPRAKVRR